MRGGGRRAAGAGRHGQMVGGAPGRAGCCTPPSRGELAGALAEAGRGAAGGGVALRLRPPSRVPPTGAVVRAAH
eukprot:7315532-Lingulodinium_polyedra.AAC.1